MHLLSSSSNCDFFLSQFSVNSQSLSGVSLAKFAITFLQHFFATSFPISIFLYRINGIRARTKRFSLLGRKVLSEFCCRVVRSRVALGHLNIWESHFRLMFSFQLSGITSEGSDPYVSGACCAFQWNLLSLIVLCLPQRLCVLTLKKNGGTLC